MGGFNANSNVVPFQAAQSLKSFALYETAKQALAECVTLIEVEQVIDQAAAIEAFAKIAKDLTLELNAVKLRIDAERRLGQLIKAQKEAGLWSKGGRPSENPVPNGQGFETVSRASLNLSRKEVKRSETYADLSSEQYEDQKKQLEQKAEKTGRVPKHLPIACEKPRKKAVVIEHKEEAVEADFADEHGFPPAGDPVETLQKMLDEVEQELFKEQEEKAAAQAEAARLAARLEAFEKDASAAVNAELVQKIATLEAKAEALALATQRDHFQGELANRQKSLNWYKEEYKKLCKATGYERPKKVSTYCTGSGYSDPNDPRHIEWVKQQEMAAQLDKEKVAANAQKKEANQWLAQNNLPADNEYRYTGKPAPKHSTHEPFADNRPKPESAAITPSDEAVKRHAAGLLDMDAYKRCRLAGLPDIVCMRSARLIK